MCHRPREGMLSESLLFDMYKASFLHIGAQLTKVRPCHLVLVVLYEVSFEINFGAQRDPFFFPKEQSSALVIPNLFVTTL